MQHMVSLTVIFSVAFLAAASIATADVPSMMQYQGFLTDEEGKPLNDTLSMTFTIYPDPNEAIVLWTETQTDVIVTNGLFHVLLGSVNSIVDTVFAETQRWLGITVAPDPEIVPRTRLVTVPYAYRAATVDGASGGTVFGDVAIQSDLDVDGDFRATGKATIGPGHTNTGTSAFMAGQNNYASGDWSAISGGATNTTSGLYSTIGGGEDNLADSNYATVGGGNGDTASGYAATVGGGYGNRARSTCATVGGGGGNLADSNYATVGGGVENTASGRMSVVSGGGLNSAGEEAYSTVGGGYADTASGEKSTVSGGVKNMASGQGSTVGGGERNLADSSYATVGGGYADTASGWRSTVSGGAYNKASNSGSVVGGGWSNVASGYASTIGGGLGHASSSSASTVGGGNYNVAEGAYSTVAGGCFNIANGYQSTVGGGYLDTASGHGSTVCGGEANHANGTYSAIGGGIANSNAGDRSAIPGGSYDTLTSNANWSMAFGNRVYINSQYRVVFFDSVYWGRLGINRDDHNGGGISYPIHVGTSTSNGNGAYLTAGGTWTNGSSRAFKENFQSLDRQELLAKISSLPVQGWQYKSSEERHIGPVSEDFVEAFDVGTVRDGRRDDKYLSPGDVAGVALAGVKELIEENQELREIIEELTQRIAKLEKAE
ncbi:MAG: hypothetical protein AMJ73_05810 [candidate division Zixibacteria bacterium SM1_73]|nr:MAG: hypothetical protein AMJ73_05810 [candidate division Zixibacteria bacterium SM1_73]